MTGAAVVQVVPGDDDRPALVSRRLTSVPSGTISPAPVAHLEQLDVLDAGRGSAPSAWSVTCQ